MKHIAIILIIISLCSCQNKSEVGSILKSAESVMSDNPQKAMSILETIDQTKLKPASLHAKYALLYSQALDKNYIDKTNDSLISIAVTYYDRKGNDEEKALAHYYQGRIYANAGDSDHAIKSFVKSEQAAIRTDDFYLLGLINNSIGNLYSAQLFLEEALVKYRQSTRFFHKAKASYNEALVLSAQARVHYLQNNCDSALIVNNRAIDLYRSIGADVEVLNLHEVIASIHVEQDKNISDVKKELVTCYSNLSLDGIPISSMGLWQSIYWKEGNLDSAKICGNKILKNRDKFSDNQIVGCLAQMEQIAIDLHDYKAAHRYCRQYSIFTDSLNTLLRNHLVVEIENKYKNQLLQESSKRLEILKKYQSVTIILLLFIFLTGGILVTILFMRWRKKTFEKMRHAQNEIHRLSSTYYDLQKQYDKIRSDFQYKDKQEVALFNAIEERLKGMHDLIEQTRVTKSTTFVRKFQEYMGINARSKSAFTDLEYVVNKRYFNVIDYLRETYPQLTKFDLDLCCLLCFGFSQYVICYLYGYSDTQSFYNKRYRLKERLGLKKDENIDDFIRKTVQTLSEK